MKKRIRRRKNIKKRRRRIAAVILLVLGLGVGIAIYYTSQIYSASYKDLDRGEKSAVREEAVDIGEDPISLLLLGVEDYSSNGENGRADTQIVLTLNPKTEEMTMTSIPRDTRVEIPAEKVGEEYAGKHKLNATYSLGALTGYGAEKLAVETVEDYLNIPIDKYATINFEGFMEVVDLFGGVTIDVKKPFWERSTVDRSNIIEFEEGPTEMDGEEALAFVRMRKRDVAVEYPRDERQRQFIKATVDQAISAGTIFKMNQLSDIVGDNISTNMSLREIYSFQKAFSSEELTTETIKIDGVNERLEDGLFYFVPDEESLDEVKTELQNRLEYTPSY
ncbi:LCP family protein [Halobacillus salinus]|uniref:LytR family transcriptional regulator n=1 Tax=Halobacillus salinus TaxID=192814 RepID=A0A4Z0H020_9BACI|nr:LCP family protein [Halobacillus salinus]TGB02383.1 LytR family transcriptional regulator [Halobacillus salinus]